MLRVGKREVNANEIDEIGKLPLATGGMEASPGIEPGCKDLQSSA